MAPPDIDIYRTAVLWIARHGDAAITEARKMSAGFQQAGNLDGEAVWLRIVLAIQALQTDRPALLS